MNQQINLYLPEFHQKKDWLNFRAMAVIAGLAVILMALASGVDFWRISTLKRDLADKQQQLENARDRTNKLSDSFGSQSEDPRLAAEVEELDENLQGKRALLRFMSGRDLGNTDGFSEYLADLSRYHIQGLRLTGIDLSNGGNSVTLSGQVLQPEYVPLYLQRLGMGKSFSGKDFETVRIGKIDDAENDRTILQFTVATTGAK